MFWKKKKPPVQEAEPDTKGEFERLTDELIQETTGPGGDMMKCFYQMLEGYSAEQNPMSTQDAKNILTGVLLVAVRQRRRLAGRIASSVERGVLYNQYYGRIQEINRCTVRANVKFERMRLARQQYEYQKEIYWGVVGRTYDQTVPADKPEKTTDSGDTPPLDVWEKMDQEWG